MCIDTRTGTHTHTHRHMYACTQTHTHTQAHVHRHTHTHIDTHTLPKSMLIEFSLPQQTCLADTHTHTYTGTTESTGEWMAVSSEKCIPTTTDFAHLSLNCIQTISRHYIGLSQ